MTPGYAGTLAGTVSDSLPSAPRPRVRSSAALPPLSQLWEQARALGAGGTEVDLLLLGLSQPLGPQEDARERADLLHRMLEDSQLGETRGSDGRRVDGAAAQALMAMGHPYAMELSPEGLDALRAAELEERSFVIHETLPAKAPLAPVVLSSRQEWGRAIAIGVGLIESLVILANGLTPVALMGLVAIALTTFLPGLLAVSSEGLHNRVLHAICLVLAALPLMPWMAATAFAYSVTRGSDSWMGALFLFPLAMALARLAMPFCLYGRRPDPEPSQAGRQSF